MYLITGANGFIGSNLVRHLNSKGIKDIICVDRVPQSERPDVLAKAEFSQYILYPDIIPWCNDLKSPFEIKAVFHLGAISSTTETNWEALKEHNIEFSQRLFTYCTKWNCPFIYASSGAVYGDGNLGFSDQSPTEKFTPLNLYGKSKQEFDLWILGQPSSRVTWQGLRFFNVYGPNEYHKENMASVAYKAFLQIKSGGNLKLFRSHNDNYGDGKQLRDFVYVKDIVNWIWEIYQKKPDNGIYNLGFGKARTWLDLANSCFKNMGQEPKIDWIDVPQNIRSQYQYFTEAEMKKSFASGLSQPQYSLEDGISDYFKNYLMTYDPFI